VLGTVTIPSNATEIAIYFQTQAFFISPAGTNDYIDFTNLKLEVGSASTPFEHPPLWETLLQCQRTYQSSANQGTAPGQNLGTGTGEFQFPAPLATTGTQRSPSIRFDPTMRAVPAMTLLNPSATNAQVRDQTAGGDCSSSAVANVSDHGFNITCTGNASTAAGNLLGVHWIADARI
jgi:hypothetical protein